MAYIQGVFVSVNGVDYYPIPMDVYPDSLLHLRVDIFDLEAAQWGMVFVIDEVSGYLVKPDGSHVELAAQSTPFMGGAWGPYGASFTWTYPVSDLGEWDIHIFAHGRRRQAFIWLPFLITEEEYDGALVLVTSEPGAPPPTIPPPAPPAGDWVSTLTGMAPLLIGVVLLGLIIPLFKGA